VAHLSAQRQALPEERRRPLDLALLVGPGGRVVGVDRSEAMLAEARTVRSGSAAPR
jgi:hypothetical protein